MELDELKVVNWKYFIFIENQIKAYKDSKDDNEIFYIQLINILFISNFSI